MVVSKDIPLDSAHSQAKRISGVRSSAQAGQASPSAANMPDMLASDQAVPTPGMLTSGFDLHQPEVLHQGLRVLSHERCGVGVDHRPGEVVDDRHP